jgi:two-component system, chemotaxis family, chemotaxis protein CheY
MVSLKKYIDSASGHPTENCGPDTEGVLGAAIQAYRAALHEIGSCSSEGCQALGAELKKSLWEIEVSLGAEIGFGAIATAERSVQGHLQAWGNRAAEHYRQKTVEVKELLILMACSADSFCERDERCAIQLIDVTDRLERIASLEDLTEVRSILEKSAAELKMLVNNIVAEGKEAIAKLKQEVSDYQVKLEEAETIASHDVLTGLHNRIWVENQIDSRIESGVPFCVAIADIDGFKKVNDDLGHLAGDELLRLFAAELESANRSTDVIARWGGDEFILVLDCDPLEAPAQIDRLAVRVCKSYKIMARTGPSMLTVGVSIGLAEHLPGETKLELLARADAAMYARKAASSAHGTDQTLDPSSIEPTNLAPTPNAGEASYTMKSLVAEDDATNRKLLQAILSRYGTCDVAVDGMEAVSAVRRAREDHQSYDLVCMDLRMPQMDGLEAIREIRKQEASAGVLRAAKIVVTTIHTDMESITEALLGRCDGYLVKPFDTAKLKKELKGLGLLQ